MSYPNKRQVLDQPLPKDGANPFAGAGEPLGPQFIDTGACFCAERTLPGSRTFTWRCLGDRTQDPYNGTSGAWFYPEGTVQNNATILPVYNADHPPDLDIRYVYQDGKLVPARGVDPFPLNMYDAACTGKNNTVLSAHYYDSLRQTANGSAPTAAAVCLSGTLPITIQKPQSWQAYGCYEGFLCTNNTINALPQYCTPVEPCLHARLGGASCGVPMGAFEPVVCTAGSYCPNGSPANITCPKGNYCPEGSFAPLKCSPGAICSDGSLKNATLLPFVFLIIIDFAFVTAMLALWVNGRHKKRKAGGSSSKPSILAKARQAVPMRKGGAYKNLDNDTIGLVEQQQPASSDMGALRRRPTGFLGPMVDFDMDAAAYSTRQSTDGNAEGNTDLREFVGSLSKCIEGSNFGLSFEYTDLGFWPKGAPRPILKSITGCIPRGSLVGVLGGSGAGKSTFVKTLMGKQEHNSGRISINGVQGKVSEYKKIIGFVPQDDIVLPELTVRENILHSARIRLPSHWKDKDIQRHVDVLIDCLQLDHVRNSLVGSTAKPVISGGQRKRVSIGMELAAAPMALFLDEPTSGLDATSASHIMKILSALSKLGITVVTIIHQPREEIWHAIDDIILLANGRLVYQGKEQDVQGFFERAGFHFPEHSNPADTLMDIIQGEGRQYKRVGDVTKDSLIEHWQQISDGKRDDGSSSWRGTGIDDVVGFRRSIKRRGAYFHKQIYFCMVRSFVQQYRLKSAFWFEMGVASLAGFLIGLSLNSKNGRLFHGLYHGGYEYLSSALDYQTLPILALLVAIGIGLVGSAPGVKVFGEEKLQYRREAASGHNKLAYYLGKLIATGPRIFFGCFHFTVFFMLLTAPRINWGKSFLANWLYYYCMYGLASCVSMITRREDGPLLATIASLIVGILSGFAPQLTQVRKWHMLWLWRASPGTWISEAYFSENITPLAYLYQIDDAATRTGMTLGRYWIDLLALIGIGTVYRILAFVLLISVRRNKQR